MKKVFAILLFSVHLFNLAGYTLVFRLLSQQNTTQTLQHIEEGNYSDDDLILVKVPVLLPYASDWSEYERYSGEIEWGGVHYNYVKRKVLNDTLYLMCLPDMNRTKLSDAHDQYTRKVNGDTNTSQKGSDTSAKVIVLSGEYTASETGYALNHPAGIIQKNYRLFSDRLMQTDSETAIQPPDISIL